MSDLNLNTNTLSNSISTSFTTLEFNKASSLIEKKIEEHLSSFKNDILEIPKCKLEKEEFLFSFKVKEITKENIYDILELLESSFEDLRISGLKNNYIIIQDRGPNRSPFKSILDGIRFKFLRLYSVQKVEITKRTDLNHIEVEACINIFKYFFSSDINLEPTAELQKLGASVFIPKIENNDENIKNNINLNSNNSTSLLNQKISVRNLVGYKKIHEQVFETIILPLKHPDIFLKVAQVTRGLTSKNMARAVLFQGPAGVGKTTMARIIAHETQIPLIYIPIENILSKYYGESSQNLAKVFDMAAMYERAVIFIDEIDALATSREQGLYEATRRLLSVLLRKIDGLESRGGILTLGSTNRTGDLDRALLSRFDTIISFNLPDLKERFLIFKNYAKHLELSSLESLAKITDKMSGRDIEDICEYAERRWARKIISDKLEVSPPPPEIYIEVSNLIQKQLSDI